MRRMSRVDEVGQHEVHQAVRAAEGDRRFRPVGGERHQPLALTARQYDAQHRRSTAHPQPPSLSASDVRSAVVAGPACPASADGLPRLEDSSYSSAVRRATASQPNSRHRALPAGLAHRGPPRRGRRSAGPGPARGPLSNASGPAPRRARAGRSRPSSTTSGMPPTAEATTAVPQAIASRLTMPSGSYTDGQTNTARVREELDHLRARQHLRDPVHAVAHGAQLVEQGAELAVRWPGCRGRRRTARAAPTGSMAPGRAQQMGHALLPGDAADEEDVRALRVDADAGEHVGARVGPVEGGVDAVVDDADPGRVERRVAGEDVVAHGVRRRR